MPGDARVVPAADKVDRIILYLIIFAVAGVPLIYLPFSLENFQFVEIEPGHLIMRMQDNIYKPKLDSLLITEFILLILIYYRMKIKGSFFKYNPCYKPLAFFAGFLVLSTVLSPYPELAIYGRPFRLEGLLAYLAYLVLFIIIANFIERWSGLKLLLFFLLTSALLISLYGLIQFFGYDFIPRNPERIRWHRAFSTLGNPDFAGSYIVMLLPLPLQLFLHSGNKKRFLFTGTISAIFFAFLIATSTRGAWIAFFLISVVMVVINRREIKLRYKPFLLLLFILILITVGMDAYRGGYIGSRFLSIFTDTRKITSEDEVERLSAGSNRLFVYKTSWPLLWARPLTGSGLDTFARVYPQEKYREFAGNNKTLDKAHSEYLQLGVTAGIPALIAYLIFLFYLFREGLKALKRKNPYQMGLFLAFISYLIQAVVNISVVAVAPVFWAVMGLNIAANKLANRGR